MMKRFHEVTLGTETLRLGVTLGALEDLVQAGIDPLEALSGAIRERDEPGYESPIRLTSLKVIEALTIGARHGDGVDPNEISGKVMAAGLIAAKIEASNYMFAFASDMSEEPSPVGPNSGTGSPEK